ncbi:putative pyruvate kinase [Helianthus anomalus]
MDTRGVHCKFGQYILARFDFTWGESEFHQETLENLKTAIKKTKNLCSVMLDTTGPELLVVNKGNHPIPLEADSFVFLTPDQEKEAISDLLPVNFGGLAKAVKPDDTIFLGQYLFTGSEATSVWLEVS